MDQISPEDIQLIPEEPPPLRRNKAGKWVKVVSTIAKDHKGEWVRIDTEFADSKKAQSAATSIVNSGKSMQLKVEKHVRTIDGQPKLWVRAS